MAGWSRDMEILTTALAVLLAFFAGMLFVRSRGREPDSGLLRELARLQADLRDLARAQEQTRLEVHRGREVSLAELSQAALGIRSELGAARRALAEVQSLEQGRMRHADQAALSLRRLEAVVAGSSARGAAGENILGRALSQLPPDLVETRVAFGGRVVEFALRLPGGRLLPLDSKWTSVAPLEDLEAAESRQDRARLVAQVARELRERIREVTRYLDPERTVGLALVAVPDAVYHAAPEVHGEGYRHGVLVVPYSLALPYALAVYRLVLRFGAAMDPVCLTARLRDAQQALSRAAEEIEGRLSRGLVLLEHARDALRRHLSEAGRAAEGVLGAVEQPGGAEARPAAGDPELTAP